MGVQSLIDRFAAARRGLNSQDTEQSSSGGYMFGFAALTLQVVIARSFYEAII